MQIFSRIARGKNAGTLLYPHLYGDGMYVVSETRFEKDYIRIATLVDVRKYISEGYSVRMSNPVEGIKAASLIAPSAISVSD